MKLCLVCSSGGHFLELFFLKDFWKDHEHFWVTFLKKDNASLLAGENVYQAYSPTNRNPVNFIRNLFLAFRILIKEKPRLIISTGAGVAVPFLYVGKLLGLKTVYLESQTRVRDLSLTGKLVYLTVDHFLVQWPELAQRYRKARCEGQVL